MATRVLIGALCLLAVAFAHSGETAKTIRIPVWIEGSEPGAHARFEVTVNGLPARITGQHGPASDQVILIVLDLSGDLSLANAARQAMISEIGRLPARTWVAVLRAQDGPRVLADPDADRQPSIEAIRSSVVTGKAALLETIEAVAALADAMMGQAAVRVTVLYVTDSDIYNYREDYTNPVINRSDSHDLSRRFPGALVQEKISRLTEHLGFLQAPVFIVALNNGRDRLNQAYQNGLIALADSTGGKAGICRSMLEIPETIGEMFSRMSATWSLTVALPESKKSLLVRVSARRGDEELRVRTRARVSLKKE